MGSTEYYVCIHETGGLVRQVFQTGIEGLSPRVRMGKEAFRGGDGGNIYPVAAISSDDLRCWIRDFNAMCQRKCVHQVTVLRDSLTPCT